MKALHWPAAVLLGACMLVSCGEDNTKERVVQMESEGTYHTRLVVTVADNVRGEPRSNTLYWLDDDTATMSFVYWLNDSLLPYDSESGLRVVVEYTDVAAGTTKTLGNSGDLDSYLAEQGYHELKVYAAPDTIGTWRGTLSTHGSDFSFTLVLGDEGQASATTAFFATSGTGTYTSSNVYLTFANVDVRLIYTIDGSTGRMSGSYSDDWGGQGTFALTKQ